MLLRVLNQWPGGASGNCDVFTKRQALEEDDRVLCTGIDELNVPPGELCLHSNTVQIMVDALGWKLQTPRFRAEQAKLREANDLLAARVAELEAALSGVREVLQQ